MSKVLPLLALALSGCIVHGHGSRPDYPPGSPLTRAEVERLAAAGISEEIVLSEIERRGVTHLAAEDLVALKKAGASEALIQKAIESERKEPEVAYVEDSPYYYHGYYPYPSYYPYYWYPSFGFGYTYHRYHRSGGSGFRFGVGW